MTATRQARNPTLLESLGQWWAEKYHLPWNHELFQTCTVEELLTEFYLEGYQKNPLEAHRNADGEIQLTNTGDPYVDKWEEEFAQGLHPDLEEMFTPEERANIDRLHRKGAPAALQHVAPQVQKVAPPLPTTFPGTFGDD
jgi:hypothetical protein